MRCSETKIGGRRKRTLFMLLSRRVYSSNTSCSSGVMSLGVWLVRLSKGFVVVWLVVVVSGSNVLSSIFEGVLCADRIRVLMLDFVQ